MIPLKILKNPLFFHDRYRLEDPYEHRDQIAKLHWVATFIATYGELLQIIKIPKQESFKNNISNRKTLLWYLVSKNDDLFKISCEFTCNDLFISQFEEWKYFSDDIPYLWIIETTARKRDELYLFLESLNDKLLDLRRKT